MSLRFLRNKRGAADQVDWAISLAIFLLFVIWFFVILRQVAPPGLQLSSEIQNIENKFKANVSFAYQELPIFVLSEKAISDYPILIDSPINWTNFILNDGLYVHEYNSSLYFSSDLVSGSNVFRLINSEKQYQSAAPDTFISNISDNVIISSKSFSARFPNNKLSAIYYNSSRYLNAFNLYMDGQQVSFLDSDFAGELVFLQYTHSSDWIVLKQFLFPDQAFIQNSFEVLNTLNGNHSFAIEFIYPELSEYASDLFGRHSLDVSRACVNITSDVIDLVDDDNGLLVKFDEPLEISMCDASNQTHDQISVKAFFDYNSDIANNNLEFVIFAHEGVYADVHEDFIPADKIKIGTLDSFEGISKTSLDSIKSFSLESLKTQWNISSESNFAISVNDRSNSVLFEISSGDYFNADVYSKTFGDFLVDEYGNKEFVFVNILVW